MTSSDDDIVAEVWRLRREGETIRKIADRTGLSKSRVGRIVAAGDPRCSRRNRRGRV